MKRSKFVRLELLVLAVVTLLLAYRVIQGPPPPSGLIVHTDLKPGQLKREAFAIDQPLRVAIDAVGSFESGQSGSRLAAYAWILRREDRSVAWKMDPTRASRDRETLALVQDTLELAPGTYDVYFASFGNRRSAHTGISVLDRLLGHEGPWRDDHDRWRVVVRRANGQDVTFHPQRSQSEAELSPRGEGLIWSTAPMRGHQRSEHVFHAAAEVPVRAYAVGEINQRQMDFGWIENAVTGERIWEMTLENTKPAGGWDVNRLFDDTLHLPAGIYRVVFETDARQSFSDWVGNPPFDPAGWGLSLFTPPTASVAEFDPWSNRTPIVQIDRVKNDESRSAQFLVKRPVQLAVFALGEMGDGGRYDYAWIRNNDTQATVWEMTYERSNPAGGHNNRRELAFLELPPGTYTVTYRTDDSHSYDSWRHGRPDHPERWGVSVFPVAADLDTSTVRLLGYSQVSLADRHGEHAPPGPPEAGVPDLPPLPGRTVVDLTRLGNEKRVSAAFDVDGPGPILVRALGEVSLSGRYDYGWIERANTGEIVWEMTWQNTRPAGGDDRNRVFDGPVVLSEGEYVAHFKTDFSHAFDDFDDQAPRNPDAWGIRISKP